MTGALTPAEWLIKHASTMSIHTTQNLSINGTSLAETEESGLTTDDILNLLANSRRREVIKVLFEHERIKFKELVWLVAEAEYQIPREEISSDERHTIYVSLTQTHLERLDKEDVISRERDTGSISLGPNANDMSSWVAKLIDNEPKSLRGKVASLF